MVQKFPAGQGKHESILRPGILVGLKGTFNSYRYILEASTVEYLNQWHSFESLTVGYSIRPDHSLYILSQNRNYLRENRLSFNYEITF